MTFNVLEPDGGGNLFRHDAVISVEDGQCGDDGRFAAPYADVAKVGRLDEASYARLAESLIGWEFQDIDVEHNDAGQILVAVFKKGESDADLDDFPFMSACSFILNNLPVEIQENGVSYDLSGLSEISVRVENKIDILIASASTSRSYTFGILNGLCVDPAAPD